MFTTAFVALLATSALAAPVLEQRGSYTPPSGWDYSSLEDYGAYHWRYLQIGCSDKHGTAFFDACCSPMQSWENIETARAPQCNPNSSSNSPSSGDDDDTKSNYESSQKKGKSKNDEKKQHDNSSPSGDVKTGGMATFFYQNGNPGACGNYNSDSDYLVAIDGAGYWSNFGQKSEYCGKWVNIKNTANGKTVSAKVQDVCPTCVSDNSLDLSVAAFDAIADQSQGTVPIEWSFA